MKKFIITICCLVLIQISGCGNDPEKHRESEVNTDTIDTTTVNQPSKISTSGTDTTTENSKKTATKNPKN